LIFALRYQAMIYLHCGWVVDALAALEIVRGGLVQYLELERSGFVVVKRRAWEWHGGEKLNLPQGLQLGWPVKP
jgi:hypothetical protein